MSLLKRENWWIWLILFFVGQGVDVYILAALIGVYRKDAWYTNWQYWVFALLCCIFPAIIMFAVFTLQITIETAQKLDVPGHEIYGSAYVWLLLVIIPIIGWILFGVLELYLSISTLVALYRGNAEKYID